tara:strand:+ start:87 stop:1796 length:1710 start_codon:yes stop_codon:yes gene_type:complete
MATSEQMQIKISADAKKLVAEFRKLETRLDKLEGKTKKTGTNMRNHFAGIRRSIGAVRNNMLLVTFALGGMTAAANKAFLAFAEFQEVERGFDSLSRAARFSSETLEGLQEAVGDTVSKTELMRMTNNALLLNVFKTEDQMIEMAAAAKKLGSALGVDAKTSVESLVLGLGRQSRLILDNIGISISAEKVYKKLAETLGVTTDALSDQQKKTAFVAAGLDQARKKAAQIEEEFPLAADEVRKLSASFDDFLVVLGERLAPTFDNVTKALTGFLDTASDLIEGKTSISGLTEDLNQNSITTDRNALVWEHLSSLWGKLPDLGPGIRGQIQAQADAHVQAQKEIEDKKALEELNDIQVRQIVDTRAFKLDLIPIEITEEELRQQRIDDIKHEIALRKMQIQQNIELARTQGKRRDAVIANISAISSLSKEMGVSMKAQMWLQYLLTIANTYASIQAAIAPPPVGYGPTPVGYGMATAAGITGAANIAATYNAYQKAEFGYSGVVDQPTMFLAGEAGAETVNVTPLEGPNVEGPTGGSGVVVNISAPLVDDTVVDTLIPAIKEAVRRGESLS